MSKSLYSPSWYRVNGMKPRLRAHAEIHRQIFRGDVWYLLQDHQTGRFHRISPAAHLVLCMMDGRRTVNDIWTRVGEKLGEDQPTQEEIIRLLAQLHGADLLVGTLPPNMEELSQRADTHVRRDFLMRIKNPLALRFPLFDPDRFLTATLPAMRPLFGVAGLVGWIMLVAAGILIGAMNATALAGSIDDQLLSAQNIALLLLAYPLVKTFHEFGHAYAVKVFGGAVHEIGVMVLIFIPVPYVDASSSSAFRNKWQRAVVGAAGIMVEAGLAAIAVMVWVAAEPGMVRALAFNVILIGGVSTLLFNGNPLLKFDGYYVLSDLVEIPNLAGRANKYVLYLIQRYGFGIDGLTSPATARGEAVWFVCYSLSAAAYRMSIMVTIALLIASKLFFIGIALALLSVGTSFVWPLIQAARFLAESPLLHRRRQRAMAISAGAMAAALLLVLAVPLPLATMAEGVIWVGEQSTVRALSDSFVAGIPAVSGSRVEAGSTLVAGEDATLIDATAVLDKQLDEMRLRLEAAMPRDIVQANILREQILHLEGQLQLSRRRLADLELTASKAGQFLMLDEADLPGRFLRKGDIVGYIVGEDDPIVRVVVPQNEVDPVRRSTLKIEVRRAEDIYHVLAARILREVPSASAEIPHLALSTAGGGQVLLDPSKTDRPKPLESLFHFDLRIADAIPRSRLGGRVYVRFEHPPEPVAYRIGRAVRQLFLRQFSV
ncbi:M50 family metallopeptidase [Bradyrhizobium sp.]|uniref:M50 family metallopeptidase n=1 Tax=Bradyrhizobium sp. TaxID=376 RepID=UPI00271ECA1C|nr:M50 family metallopeptidase [Bradyrhizobium sp.]MDO9297065.1 M50 family metallopeptidase [Bradyrhizobium sp.]